MDVIEKRKCTSKTYKKGEKSEECGTPLLLIMTTDGQEGPWICPECDSLEYLPKKMRERILEQ